MQTYQHKVENCTTASTVPLSEKPTVVRKNDRDEMTRRVADSFLQKGAFCFLLTYSLAVPCTRQYGVTTLCITIYLSENINLSHLSIPPTDEPPIHHSPSHQRRRWWERLVLTPGSHLSNSYIRRPGAVARHNPCLTSKSKEVTRQRDLTRT